MGSPPAAHMPLATRPHHDRLRREHAVSRGEGLAAWILLGCYAEIPETDPLAHRHCASSTIANRRRTRDFAPSIGSPTAKPGIGHHPIPNSPSSPERSFRSVSRREAQPVAPRREQPALPGAGRPPGSMQPRRTGHNASSHHCSTRSPRRVDPDQVLPAATQR